MDKPDLIYDPKHKAVFERHAEAFKRDLLIYKRAKRNIYKTDGTVEKEIWKADRMTSTSKLENNIVTNKKVKRYIQEGTLARIEFFIIR